MTGKVDTVQAGTPAWLNTLLAVGGLGTLVGGLGVWAKNIIDGRLAKKKDGREASLDHVELVSRAWDEYDKLIERLSKAEARAQSADERADQADKASRETRRDLDDITERVRHLETDTSHIVGFLVIVKQGIADGTIPPWPEETPVVRAYMARIETTTITQEQDQE